MIIVEELWNFMQKWVLCMGNTYFKYRSLHKYTVHKSGVEIKSRIDLVLVMRDMLQYVKDVRVVRGMG